MHIHVSTTHIHTKHTTAAQGMMAAPPLLIPVEGTAQALARPAQHVPSPAGPFLAGPIPLWPHAGVSLARLGLAQPGVGTGGQAQSQNGGGSWPLDGVDRVAQGRDNGGDAEGQCRWGGPGVGRRWVGGTQSLRCAVAAGSPRAGRGLGARAPPTLLYTYCAYPLPLSILAAEEVGSCATDCTE